MFPPSLGTKSIYRHPHPLSDIEYLIIKKRRNYISYQQYLALCKKYGLSKEDADNLSGYFHQIGVFLHFRDDIYLSKTVFLNHRWVTKGVYNVLDNKKVLANKGRFSDEDLKHIWQGEGFDEKRGELLRLMKNDKFRICLR